MTIKLFYKNTYIKEFNANIVQIVEKNDLYHIELNHSAFYPEGGGQPSDTGYIDDIEVSHVYEEKDKVYHVTDKLPNKLENLRCTIDWEKRFDHMQQHLGQHIISAAFQNLYDANTIGFHLSENSVTIDIDKALTNEDISKVEYYSNQIVFNDLAVEIINPTKEEIINLPLRKLPTVEDKIRVVKINDFDYSPCCGTHPNRTGEVGLIKIKRFEKYKSGLRIEFICGNRALEDYRVKNDIINSLSSSLSVKPNEILSNIKRINEEFQNTQKEYKKLKEQVLNFEAIDFLDNAERVDNIKIIKTLFDGREFGEIKQLSSTIVSNDKTIVIFGINNGDKATLLFSRSRDLNEFDMREILSKCIPLIDGKGGGSPFSAQGGGKNIDSLEEAINFAYKLVTECI